MKSTIKIVGVVLLSALPFLAQNATTIKVDNFIKAEMRKQSIPGLSLAVVKEGKIIYAKGYGYSNLEHKVPVKPETIFQTGSVGKQFTSMAVMMLVEDGKIGLDEPIGKYINNVPQGWGKITIRHLLNHTSGLPDDFSDADYQRDYSEDEQLKLAEKSSLEFQPGEKWSYSNVGYVVLGIMISKVTGKFYGDFMQE